ncbi:MAG: hypothetical protein UU67_C0073G0007 [Candidatus Daviesbacteria bacterium GW2011_GWB1_41_5]|uniref:Small multidrug resistance protein n=1 Tax=Candidatus Daviesbacteria bacterium GW2011_GWB1_41_5 TaxID=1618429 RepID=A0A0G0YP89_9BACT|nr:MAG: hypothetical protein UU67_C0073G0007 [Candidatus Daviesbacteria bacterium GW2011_GWB1_41_5]
MNWLLIVFVGAIGAVADVVLSYWSYTHKLQWWLGGAVLYLIFMSGLGLIVRQGVVNGYSLAVGVVVVLLVNIVLVAAWDVHSGASLSVLQWFGIVLALGAMACLELGRNS